MIDIADVEAHLLVGEIIDQSRRASLEAGFVLVDTHGDERALHGIDRALVGDVVLEHDAGNPHCRLQAEVEADHAGAFPAIISAAGDVDEARDRRRRHEVAAAHAPRLRKAQIVAGALLDSRIKCQLHLIGIVGQAEVGAAQVAERHEAVFLRQLLELREDGFVDGLRQLLNERGFGNRNRAVGIDAHHDFAQARVALFKRHVDRDGATRGVEAGGDGAPVPGRLIAGDAEFDAIADERERNAGLFQRVEGHLIVLVR